MKFLMLAVLLAVMQAGPPAPRQAADGSKSASNADQSKSSRGKTSADKPESPFKAKTTGDDEGSKQQPEAPAQNKAASVVHDSDANGANKNTTDEESKTQRELAWFTGALVAVSFLQFVALIWQARLFFRQAGIMEEHKTSLVQLAAAASENATAASNNADAARQAVDIVISKERARLSVRVHELVLAEPTALQGVALTVQFSGLTAAYILESMAVACLSDSVEQPSPPFTLSVPSLPSPITLETEELHRSSMLLPNMVLGEVGINDVLEGRKFIHFWGFIKYRMPFMTCSKKKGRLHSDGCGSFASFPMGETGLPLTSPGRRRGYWAAYGLPTDNRET
jgi:hypothetical protein